VTPRKRSGLGRTCKARTWTRGRASRPRSCIYGTMRQSISTFGEVASILSLKLLEANNAHIRAVSFLPRRLCRNPGGSSRWTSSATMKIFRAQMRSERCGGLATYFHFPPLAFNLLVSRPMYVAMPRLSSACQPRSDGVFRGGGKEEGTSKGRGLTGRLDPPC